MSGYLYNRQNFAWSRTELAFTYCRLVAIELSLKEHLGVMSSGGNGGHNIPDLLQGLISRLQPSATRTALISLVGQLTGALNALWCQGRDGKPTRVPARSYPYLRYVRHHSDAWVPQYSTDLEIDRLDKVVGQVWVNLKSVGVVQ